GEVVYEVALKENGLNRDVRIDSNGRILGDVAAPLSPPSSAANNVLLVSVTPTPFNDVPWRVQHAIQAKAGLDFNAPVQVGTWDAQKVYQVNIPANGQTKVFQLTEQGQDVAMLQKNPPEVASLEAVAAGAPATTTSGTASSGTVATKAAVVPLSNTNTVTFNDVPWRAQHAFQKQFGQTWNNPVQKGQWNGQTVYQATVPLRGQPITVQFNENGQVPSAVASGNAAPAVATPSRNAQPAGSVTRNAAPPPRSTPYTLSSGSKVTLEQAPIAVRDALKAETAGAPVEDLERGLAEGRVVYEAAFKSNGRTVELQLGADGSVLHDPRNPNRTLRPAARGSAVQLGSSQKVEPAQAPFAVRNTLAEQLGSNRLEDLEKGTYQGRTIYEAGFKDGGKHVELQISEDGTVLFDPRNPGATGGSGAAATGAASSKYGNVTSAVTLGSGSKITMEQAPEAVRRAVQAQAGGANIEDIERGKWNGQTVYEAAFKANGKHVELQMDENGEIIFDPRNAANK
ncbi:MAG: PepSY-like domain-containing protein, partial [Verrucomicrobiales bacterium]